MRLMAPCVGHHMTPLAYLVPLPTCLFVQKRVIDRLSRRIPIQITESKICGSLWVIMQDPIKDDKD